MLTFWLAFWLAAQVKSFAGDVGGREARTNQREGHCQLGFGKVNR